MVESQTAPKVTAQLPQPASTTCRAGGAVGLRAATKRGSHAGAQAGRVFGAGFAHCARRASCSHRDSPSDRPSMASTAACGNRQETRRHRRCSSSASRCAIFPPAQPLAARSETVTPRRASSRRCSRSRRASPLSSRPRPRPRRRARDRSTRWRRRRSRAGSRRTAPSSTGRRSRRTRRSAARACVS